MLECSIRKGLYLERLLVAFSSGLFLVLPLYFKSLGKSEMFFGQIYAVGAISTLICVSMGAIMIRRFGLGNIAPVGSLLFAMGSLVYCLGAASHGASAIYMLASLLQGAGWGLVFTMGPICLSSTVSDTNRSYYFTIYAAYSTLGVGLAPIAARLAMSSWGWSYQQLFLTGVAASLMACAVSIAVSRNNALYATVRAGASLSGLIELVAILKQPSIFFFGMVLFGACVYTAMINLQTTFAAAQGIDYTVFYFFYSLAVVLSRFFLSKPLGKFSPSAAIFSLLLLMIFALVLMFWAERSIICYAAGSLLLGISYGLVYPIIQAQATNHAPPDLRAQTLVYFSLSYFIAVYLFPYFGAAIAVSHGYAAMILALVLAAALELLVAAYFYEVVQRRAVVALNK